MIKRDKKAQLELSFGMIFSIIIIISTIAIAFYVITYFINLGRCTDLSLFYKSFDDRVETAWNSPITKDTFTGKVPSDIEEICFGSLTEIPSAYRTEYDILVKYRSAKANLFTYPLTKSCSNSVPFYNIKHGTSNEFFCVPAKDGNVRFTISKETSDALVQISK